MITALTDEQKKRFPEFVEKWTKIGLSTERADRPRAENAIKKIYKLAKLEEPEIVWCKCPMCAAISAMIISMLSRSSKKNISRKSINKIVESAKGIDTSVHQVIVDDICRTVETVFKFKTESVRYEQHLSLKRKDGYAFFGGSLWAAYPAFFDYFNEVLKIEIDRSYLDMAESCGYYWTLDKLAILSDKPLEIHRNSNKQLHKQNSMAIKYESGWGLYVLNGVCVPKDVACTYAGDMDKDFLVTYYFKETNAEVRREVIRKMGYELFAQRAGAKVIDRWNDYELLKIDLKGTTGKWTFLKMVNPSLGCNHVEPVSKECKTVEQALHFRKPEEMKKIPINDEFGEDWFQQGDVYVWSREAKVLKRYPSILT
jgi:hypothetical protein